ncbi:uncharacterized protein NPIL_240401 [Nephila pilipes]|uniref:G-protein coupled receptors family 1 profile domain-containing protein n=1 Tax=Nephila pilipes TaxID=299642 RepID=A0A8X6MG88_NEPPI|nr:uncharacterized protein NPIL_240401 [Nephila pilipes]
MITSDVLNASVGAINIELIKNSTRFSEMLNRKKLVLDRNLCNDWFLFYITVFSAFGHAIAILVHSNTSYRRSETWYCMVHFLIVGLSNGFLPMLSKINMECYISFGEEAFQPMKYFRTFFLSLHTYVLVVLALHSYNLIFKTLMPTPAPRSRLYAIMVCLYTISSLPSLLLYVSQRYYNSGEQSPGIPYYIYTWQFTYYPGAINIGILLALNYIIPIYLMYIFFRKVCLELWATPDPDEYDGPIYELSESDRRFISMSYTVCLSFVSTNVPFIIHELMVLFLKPTHINATAASFVELLSVSDVCMYPFLYLMFELASVIAKYTRRYEDTKEQLLYDKDGIRVCFCCARPILPEINKKDLALLLKSIPDVGGKMDISRTVIKIC